MNDDKKTVVTEVGKGEGFKVRIFDLDKGLTEYEHVKIVRIVSKDYNLLIMDPRCLPVRECRAVNRNFLLRAVHAEVIKIADACLFCFNQSLVHLTSIIISSSHIPPHPSREPPDGLCRDNSFCHRSPHGGRLFCFHRHGNRSSALPNLRPPTPQ